ALDGAPPVAARESMQALHERDEDVADQARAILRRPLAEHPELALRGRPIAASGERHREMRGVEQQALAVEPLPRDLDERLPAVADRLADQRQPPEQRDRVVQIAGDRRRRALERAAADGRRTLELT